jgi:hypothetical protein
LTFTSVFSPLSCLFCGVLVASTLPLVTGSGCHTELTRRKGVTLEPLSNLACVEYGTNGPKASALKIAQMYGCSCS